MKEFIDKLIERLGKLRDRYIDNYASYSQSVDYGKTIGLNDAISIVNQLAEEYKDKVMIDGQYCWQTCSATEHCKECNRLFNGSIDYYENYDVLAEEYKVSVMPTGWIPCSERLPDTEHISGVSETVLVTTDINSIYTAEYHGNGKWLDDVADWSLDVIAWMPLPAPYTEGE